MEFRGYKPEKQADDLALNELLGLIEEAEKPVLYVGGGIISEAVRKSCSNSWSETQHPGVPPRSWASAASPRIIPFPLNGSACTAPYYANARE